MGKSKFIVAEKKNQSGKVVPGKVLSENSYRQAEFARHDLEKLARNHALRPDQVGVFCNGEFVRT